MAPRNHILKGYEGNTTLFMFMIHLWAVMKTANKSDPEFLERDNLTIPCLQEEQFFSYWPKNWARDTFNLLYVFINFFYQIFNLIVSLSEFHNNCDSL